IPTCRGHARQCRGRPGSVFFAISEHAMKRLSRLLLAAIAASGLGVASAASTTDLRTELAAGLALPVAPSGAVVPLAACDVGEPDLIVHDDGELENGYGYNALA